MARKLRIAFSVGCGIACLLLIALWVRSYWWVTNIQTPPVASRPLQCALEPGRIRIESVLLRTAEDKADWLVLLMHFNKSSPHFAAFNYPSPSFVLRYNDHKSGVIRIIFPYWFVILIAGAASVAPWIRWRFGLRTLLIATTLVAVALGLIVLAAR